MVRQLLMARKPPCLLCQPSRLPGLISSSIGSDRTTDQSLWESDLKGKPYQPEEKETQLVYTNKEKAVDAISGKGNNFVDKERNYNIYQREKRDRVSCPNISQRAYRCDGNARMTKEKGNHASPYGSSSATAGCY